MWSCLFLVATAAELYAVRDPVRVNHTVPIKFKDGREVNLVTRSDFSTGLPVFEIKDFLTEEECRRIRSTGSEMFKSLTSTDEDKGRPMTTRRAAQMFKDLDEDGDKSLDTKELAEFFREASDLVDFSWDFVARANITVRDKKVRKKDFVSANWNSFFQLASKNHPEWFARHSRQIWLDYSDSLLQNVLDKVAAVTGLPENLVRQTAESMQVLRYPANGGHYSCHHDSAPDQDDIRFMTLFFFLNDVKDGGETVLFGTDMNGSFPGRSQSGEDVWGPIESQCQSVQSCPNSLGQMPWPFSSALVMKPRMGTALMWYNTAVDSAGRVGDFYWSSIHGGCPTRAEEKWAANIWLHAASGDKEL